MVCVLSAEMRDELHELHELHELYECYRPCRDSSADGQVQKMYENKQREGLQDEKVEQKMDGIHSA